MAKEKTKGQPPENATAPKEKKPKGGAQGKNKGTRNDQPKTERVIEEKVFPRLSELYKKEIVSSLVKRFAYKNPMQVPRLEKISINCGVGAATQDPKILETVVRDMAIITGQKPAVTRSKKAISNFKLRENLAIGCKITLRKEKMFEFMDRLISLAIPRVRDFRGVSDKSFDGRGNYTLGLKEQIIFPEIDVDKVERIFGMDITFVTTARTDEEAYELLKSFGMPFRRKETAEAPMEKAA